MIDTFDRLNKEEVSNTISELINKKRNMVRKNKKEKPKDNVPAIDNTDQVDEEHRSTSDSFDFIDIVYLRKREQKRILAKFKGKKELSKDDIYSAYIMISILFGFTVAANDCHSMIHSIYVHIYKSSLIF